jgi:hypothetical protein
MQTNKQKGQKFHPVMYNKGRAISQSPWQHNGQQRYNICRNLYVKKKVNKLDEMEP